MAVINRTTLSLRIAGDALDPGEISRLLGGEPTLARRKGDPVSSKGTQPILARTGMWSRTAADRASGDIKQQITEVLFGLTNDLSIWADLTSRFSADIFVGAFMADWNEGIELSAPTLKLLSDRGLALGFDLYGPMGKTGKQ